MAELPCRYSVSVFQFTVPCTVKVPLTVSKYLKPPLLMFSVSPASSVAGPVTPGV